jgi:GH24 family phage-related lysozyme (muramidase)
MLTNLHTTFQFGSYLADRTDLLQQRENPDLKRSPTNPVFLRPDFDGKDSLALGYGFDLLVRSNAQILAALQAVGLTDAAVGWASASQKAHDLNLLDIYRQTRSGVSKTEWDSRAGKLFLHLPTEIKATELLNLLAADAETKLNQVLIGGGILLPDSKERLALVSMVFNGGTGLIGPKLLNALQTDNRAEAWYQIRYATNAESRSQDQQEQAVGPGIANRRYAEADLFGLYGSGPISDIESKEVLRMFTTYRDLSFKDGGIRAYEAQFRASSPNAGSQGIDFQIFAARQHLISIFSEGQTIDGDVLVGQDEPNGGNTLIGTPSNDLLLGEQGNDILIGGEGDDVLRGGDGFDLYIYNSATDGNDRIEDSDAKGVIVVDGHQLSGGLKKANDSTWESPDGLFEYRLVGTDLKVSVVGTTVELTINENFQSGQFGIRLTDAPSSFEAEPALPQADRTDYRRIDHYVQVGNNPDGTPILEPVYVPLFDENANDSANASPSIGDEANTIVALGGNDTVTTGAGPDSIDGGEGDDTLWAGDGNNSVFGGNGNDSIVAGEGNDQLDGGAGAGVGNGSWRCFLPVRGEH